MCYVNKTIYFPWKTACNSSVSVIVVFLHLQKSLQKGFHSLALLEVTYAYITWGSLFSGHPFPPYSNVGCAKLWIHKPWSSWGTLNFLISFWELQAYALLHDEVTDFSLYTCWSVSEFQATTTVAELKRIRIIVKVLLIIAGLIHYLTVKDCCRQSL